MIKFVRILLAFLLLLSAAPAADSPAVQGFSSDSATSERAWEAIIKAEPSPER